MDYTVYNPYSIPYLYLRARLVLTDHQSWLAFGITSPDSPNSMIPGEAIIGRMDDDDDASVYKYTMSNYAADFITQRDELQQTLLDTRFVQNETGTVMEFTKRLEENDEYLIQINDGNGVASVQNTFMWAFGSSNTFGYHQSRGTFTLELNTCEEVLQTTSPTSAPVTPAPTILGATLQPTRFPTNTPTAAPTTNSPTATPTIGRSEIPTTSLQPTSADVGVVDCSQFQREVQLNEQLSMQYVVHENEEDGELYISAQLVLEGVQAWLGFGINSPGSVSMVPGESIIGLPTIDSILTRQNGGLPNKNVQKYSLGEYSPQGVQPFPMAQQTLNNTWVEQNSTVTIMRFTKKLLEENELMIHASRKDDLDSELRVNNFMWAYGFSNNLGFHAAKGAFALTLKVCVAGDAIGDDDGGGFIELDVGESYEALWAVHGLLATLAWGVMSPLAIGSAVLRKYITCNNDKGLWYKCHYYLNMSTLVLTMISFSIAVVAHQKGTPKGQNPKHFVAFAHATVGLAIMVAVLIQVTNGVLRPHATPKGEVKKVGRSVWEYGHRIIGTVLIAICWYQIRDGMKIYSRNFNQTDYRIFFYCVTGGIIGLIVLIYTCSNKPRQMGNNDDDDDDDTDDIKSEKDYNKGTIMHHHHQEQKVNHNKNTTLIYESHQPQRQQQPQHHQQHQRQHDVVVNRYIPSSEYIANQPTIRNHPTLAAHRGESFSSC